jgi:HET-S-like prion-inhibition and propagation protein
MQPVGLCTGVIGLAGLFTACLDAIDRAKTYKSFAFDSEALRVQFDGHNLRLEEWGRKVGLDRGKLGAGHHGRLNDPDTRKLAEDILNTIQKVIEDGGGNSPSLSARKAGELDSLGLRFVGMAPSSAGPHSLCAR